jgi:hypothetical protein
MLEFAKSKRNFPFVLHAMADKVGDAKSSLGDAKSSLGDAKSSLGDANRRRSRCWGCSPAEGRFAKWRPT